MAENITYDTKDVLNETFSGLCRLADMRLDLVESVPVRFWEHKQGEAIK